MRTAFLAVSETHMSCLFFSGGNVIKRKKVKSKVVPVLNLIKHYAMKAYGGVDV
jgi:hypothetical protein